MNSDHLTMAAMSCLLGITHPASRSYVDPNRLFAYEASSKLRILHLSMPEHVRIEQTLETMAAWQECVVAARGFVQGSTHTEQSVEIWARAALATLSAPPKIGSSWAERGFSDRAIEVVRQMAPEVPKAEPKLSREDEDRLARLRYDARFATGEDLAEIREQIASLTGED
jgi:hypothetical protein